MDVAEMCFLPTDISDLGSELSQAPPSHIPPPPRHGQRSPDGSRTNSPVYVTPSTKKAKWEGDVGISFQYGYP